MDTDKELERFQPLLKQPDYVMEPGCGETIRKYVEIGGLSKVEEVVNMLTSNYIGVAQVTFQKENCSQKNPST